MNQKEAGRLGGLKSKETHAKLKQERINNYYKNPKRCSFCNSILPYEKRHNKFCQNSCSASFNNAKRKRVPWTKHLEDRYERQIELKDGKEIISYKKREKFCLYCGKPISVNKKYCNNKCQGQYKSKQFLEKAFKDNNLSISSNGQLKHSVRLFLIQQRGNKCELCGWDKINPHTGKSPLEIHHKDGNWQNNNLDNLLVVCPNCHSLTDNYKAVNKGKGRACRRKKTF